MEWHHRRTDPQSSSWHRGERAEGHADPEAHDHESVCRHGGRWLLGYPHTGQDLRELQTRPKIFPGARPAPTTSQDRPPPADTRRTDDVRTVGCGDSRCTVMERWQCPVPCVRVGPLSAVGTTPRPGSEASDTTSARSGPSRGGPGVDWGQEDGGPGRRTGNGERLTHHLVLHGLYSAIQGRDLTRRTEPGQTEGTTTKAPGPTKSLQGNRVPNTTCDSPHPESSTTALRPRRNGMGGLRAQKWNTKPL